MRTLLAVCCASLLYGLPLASQTAATITIPGAAVSGGKPNQCELGVAPSLGAADTLTIRVVDTARKTVRPASDLVVYLGVDTLAVISEKQDTPFVKSLAKGTLETNRVSIKRADAIGFLCSVAPRVGGSITPVSANVARVMAGDSGVLDSVRNVQKLRGQSFVILSLIKSVSGFIPRDEFFDLRLKFGRSFTEESLTDAGPARRADGTVGPHKPKKANLFRYIGQNTFTMASIDIALGTRQDTSSADSSGRRLTDAGVSLNVPTFLTPGIAPMRMGYVSTLFKVFNTRSYIGAGYGGLELPGSRLEGSFVQVSYLYLLYRDSTDVTPKNTDGTTQSPRVFDYASKHNAFVEFYIRVPGAQFLDRLRIRGGILLPIGRPSGTRSRGPIDSRIVLSVPVVDLDRF